MSEPAESQEGAILTAIDVIDVIDFSATVASLAIAGVAIWIALHHKREVDRVNNETRDLLTEIKSDAKSVSRVAFSELRDYGKAAREAWRSQISGSEIRKSENDRESGDGESQTLIRLKTLNF